MDTREFQKLKADMERIQREADRADGAYKEQQSRMKDEFDVKTVKEAEAMMRKLDAEYKKADAAFRKAASTFENKWFEVLEDL